MTTVAGTSVRRRWCPNRLTVERWASSESCTCTSWSFATDMSLALNWNLGEENTQSTAEIRQMAQYLHDVDPSIIPS